jgi:hypothetical protein
MAVETVVALQNHFPSTGTHAILSAQVTDLTVLALLAIPTTTAPVMYKASDHSVAPSLLVVGFVNSLQVMTTYAYIENMVEGAK